MSVRGGAEWPNYDSFEERCAPRVLESFKKGTEIGFICGCLAGAIFVSVGIPFIVGVFTWLK